MLKHCKIWEGKHDRAGYAYEREGYVIRGIYNRVFGEPPYGYRIHHLCRNKWCVNPAHLIAVDAHTHGSFHPSSSDMNPMVACLHAEALYSKTLEAAPRSRWYRCNFRTYKE